MPETSPEGTGTIEALSLSTTSSGAPAEGASSPETRADARPPPGADIRPGDHESAPSWVLR